MNNNLHEQEANDESGTLAVSDLAVVQAVSLHDVEEAFLAEAVLLLEEVMLGIGARYVPAYDALAGRGGLYVVGELLFHRWVVRAAQQLPDDTPVMSMDKLFISRQDVHEEIIIISVCKLHYNK